MPMCLNCGNSLESKVDFVDNRRPLVLIQISVLMVTLIGPLAMIDGKPRQARKGATVAVDSCAGVWLIWVATHFNTSFQYC